MTNFPSIDTKRELLGKFIGFNDRGIVYYSDGLAVTGYTTPTATCRNCGATAKGEKAKEWQFGHINCPKPNGYFLRNDFTAQDLIDAFSQVRTQAIEEERKRVVEEIREKIKELKESGFGDNEPKVIQANLYDMSLVAWGQKPLTDSEKYDFYRGIEYGCSWLFGHLTNP
jgi:hypothetical protein